ncbi:MAG TPA: hypothetical protein V6D18_05255, partial [Thermosynechococcaceae cyanobacterium]
LTRHYGDSLGSYRRAFKELRGQLPPLEDYAFATWADDRVLPWSHLQGPLPAATLLKHRETSFPSGFTTSVPSLSVASR